MRCEQGPRFMAQIIYEGLAPLCPQNRVTTEENFRHLRGFSAFAMADAAASAKSSTSFVGIIKFEGGKNLRELRKSPLNIIEAGIIVDGT